MYVYVYIGVFAYYMRSKQCGYLGPCDGDGHETVLNRCGTRSLRSPAGSEVRRGAVHHIMLYCATS